MAKVLVVEDNEEYADVLRVILEEQKHTVDRAADGQSAFELINSFHYELLVLDWNLPGLTGLEICKKLRRQGNTVPVLFLTSNDSIDHKVTGYDTGADDYVTKPVHPKELQSRVRALLRRPGTYVAENLTAGNVALESRTHTVTKDGLPVRLFPREFALLEFLLKNKGQVFSQGDLLDRVWSSEVGVTLDSVKACVNRLRAKIDSSGKPSIVRTVYSVGYTIDPD